MGASILIVDDEPGILGLFEDALSTLPLRLVTASSAPDALAVAAGERFDLVLCDLCLGNDSGLRVLEGLAGGPPVMMMSGMWNAAAQKRARELGAVALWDKPFDIDALRRDIARYAGVPVPDTRRAG